MSIGTDREVSDLLCPACGASGDLERSHRRLKRSHRRLVEAPLRIIRAPMYRCSACGSRYAYIGRGRIVVRDIYVRAATLFIGLWLLVFVVSIWQQARPSEAAASSGSAPTTPAAISDKTVPYLHADPNFVFQYSSSFRPNRLDDPSGGETILFQSGSARFQLHLAPFTGGGTVTLDRIRRDLPDLQASSPSQVSMGGAAALAFLSGDGAAQTREVWWIRDGILYQITTYPSQDKMIEQVLGSWEWGSVPVNTAAPLRIP